MTLRFIFDYLKHNKIPRSLSHKKFLKEFGENLLFYEGVILFKTFNNEKVSLLVVVPETLRKGLIKFEHEALWTAHSGPIKTLEKLKKNFWWPKMTTDIRDFCSECITCQKKNSPNFKTITAPLRPCLLYTSPSPRDKRQSRMPSSA